MLRRALENVDRYGGEIAIICGGHAPRAYVLSLNAIGQSCTREARDVGDHAIAMVGR